MIRPSCYAPLGFFSDRSDYCRWTEAYSFGWAFLVGVPGLGWPEFLQRAIYEPNYTRL